MFTVTDKQQQQNAFTSVPKNSGSMQSVDRPLDSLYLLQRNLGNGYFQATSQTSLSSCELRIQRACACGGSCASCRQQEDDQPKLQTKLAVGFPNDVYEQEADRIADQIIRMPDPAVDESQSDMAAASVQTKRSRQWSAENAPEIDDHLESQLNQSRGGGSPLPDDVRAFMEPRFGIDFSQVRIHTDSEAVEMNRALKSQAFTYQNDIYFDAGKYVPGSVAGKYLLAHELTHVVQQTSNSVSPLLVYLQEV